jgi:trans-aconitate methyltransferase
MSEESYDEVPYHSFSFPESHPDRMATVAHLFSLKPVPPDNSRVLELGCSMGGNIAPMAAQYPNSQFLGIDYSKRQIEQGKALLDPLGMKNLEIRHASILDVDESYGKFDYIVCHGVYSWVPDNVQDKIMAICHDNLSENGVAYVSYNTLPGWHMRGMIRDMMRYHAMRFKEPQVRIAQARALLDFIAKSVGTEANNPYSSLLKVETEFLKQSEDWYLYHEHLEEVNAPVYFHQFIERAQAKGLRFLGESMVRQMVPGNYPQEVEQVLQRLAPDIVYMEQYMDFLRNRMFRQTLLCHPEMQPQYALNPDRLVGLQVASGLKPENKEPDVKTNASETFKMPVGTANVQITDPLCKNAMMVLVERFPASISFEDLCLEARRRLSPLMRDPDEVTKNRDRQMIGRMVLQFYMSLVDRLVELRKLPVPGASPGVRQPGRDEPQARTRQPRRVRAPDPAQPRRHVRPAETGRPAGRAGHDGRAECAQGRPARHGSCSGAPVGRSGAERGADPVRELQLPDCVRKTNRGIAEIDHWSLIIGH